MSRCRALNSFLHFVLMKSDNYTGARVRVEQLDTNRQLPTNHLLLQCLEFVRNGRRKGDIVGKIHGRITVETIVQVSQIRRRNACSATNTVRSGGGLVTILLINLFVRNNRRYCPDVFLYLYSSFHFLSTFYLFSSVMIFLSSITLFISFSSSVSHRHCNKSVKRISEESLRVLLTAAKALPRDRVLPMIRNIRGISRHVSRCDRCCLALAAVATRLLNNPRAWVHQSNEAGVSCMNNSSCTTRYILANNDIRPLLIGTNQV